MNDADANADSPMKHTTVTLNGQDHPVYEDENQTLLSVSEEEEVPTRYHRIFENFSQLGNLFTLDDWLDILTQSRGSYEDKLRGRRR